ncbi:twin-arginine translocase TatA/TatE family subunit [Collinsella aerofaciens]|uniref:twin-arginine translocase TatA/TatE family subunit n=1 Tax=Collinsella aerofaciens TaxID=74426 RepID=UPI00232CE4E7|nr:twin-arginine translocase TatA/TatE family subunit [Collinsella aerofaciens]MDB1879911.1 twin-arginine translocase TatA/TatE family subunit [Collinsella aerofaciens]MDB1881848.1 twin-arginine translocase TatA/TatE family subunit [Collinsella aerofaciens]MDB1883933.1 twin-arginine translocase TatA/TatE family subunit [Collinsella aerofaciens]MDB1887728.1 twin-arginine translocase TatA/TatE family subunit [Collinsella aerofaciens]
MFGIGEGELAIIVVFGFLLFGPDKLPQMGRTIGRAIRQFRETQEKMTAVVQSEIIDPVSEAASAPVKPKKTAVDDDSDADEDAAETAAPAKKETFAERRARLAAEKAASEGAAEGEGAAEESEAESAEPAAAAEPVVEPEPAAEPESEPEPAEPTTADLYARRPRKRKAVVDQLARELEAEDDAATADAPKGGDE